ncbi:zeta toxin family protein [Hydrogenophaga sp.]|uniref:zeta toxin family protein n=1 Tax=Hydrogenophaga sp. TaxID=1904254 RepID=UPI00271DFEC7|nr:zeta toxin family protein [Hydrogenophaga sp.]MDO9436318.1 zeta toxin family protein [Hydrogenophaga sp.]
MTTLEQAVAEVLLVQRRSKKPLAVILAGHNGSGKSTMWRSHLSSSFQIPLVNADRMMLSILPETDSGGKLIKWAQHLRDADASWMRVAQKGVEAFVGQAMARGVPFAMETVFSYWEEMTDGTVKSKIDLIREMQQAGYFVLLFFVGLSDVQLSIGRVMTRIAEGGHAVNVDKLQDRFPRTQKAITAASSVANATIFTDNSRTARQAFTVCRIQIAEREAFDMRDSAGRRMPREISEWLNVVSPRPAE